MASTLAITSSDKLDQRFALLRSSGRKALVCYITAGYPDYTRSLELLRGLGDAGADVVEVGVPFSDPIADGPVIQESSQRALDQGMNLDRVLALVDEAQVEVPVALAFVRLVAPTTPVERMKEIARNGSGFVYLISRLGVTGVKSDLPNDLAATAAKLRSATDLPICIGFGVSEPAQARAISRLADGVVVGSAVVRESGRGVEQALTLTRSLRAALDDQ